MKTQANNDGVSTPEIPEIPGSVIDRDTGRVCALQVDIMRALNLVGNQVRLTGARVYQGRYYDVLDVIEARKRVRRKGPRPRSQAGFAGLDVISAMVGMLTALSLTLGTLGTCLRAIQDTEGLDRRDQVLELTVLELTEPLTGEGADSE